ncbi:hypothetical protein IPdc08_00082 [archaeon]|nr:hypothetical protein IPdc08_00082 [archaeon]
MAVEPLAGKRIVEVRKRRTKKDYALFMKKVEREYPKAKKIILVQDNLNTHNPSSFYETFSPKSAFRLAQRFQMVYTPKKASWLNMAEIELSTLSKQCLDRRIDDQETFSKEYMLGPDNVTAEKRPFPGSLPRAKPGRNLRDITVISRIYLIMSFPQKRGSIQGDTGFRRHDKMY